jgi:tRNA uridine 5-carboxymethylaminomethyl modification enzyme
MTLPNAGKGVEDDQVAQQVETQAKYQGYIERQKGEVDRRTEQEELKLPVELNYRAVRGLSNEVLQKLERQRPETLGQAARISGVTPAAISLLLVHLKRGLPPQTKRA